VRSWAATLRSGNRQDSVDTDRVERRRVARGHVLGRLNSSLASVGWGQERLTMGPALWTNVPMPGAAQLID
jgi:hypothetical protein